MSRLVLELRPGEMMIINGAPIRFCSKARIELMAHARFLFGKQIMPPETADTPARRLYLALQAAYVGTDEERVRGLDDARAWAAACKTATPSALVRDIPARPLAAAEAGQYYTALSLPRQIIRHEDVMLGRLPVSPQEGAPRPWVA